MLVRSPTDQLHEVEAALAIPESRQTGTNAGISVEWLGNQAGHGPLHAAEVTRASRAIVEATMTQGPAGETQLPSAPAAIPAADAAALFVLRRESMKQVLE